MDVADACDSAVTVESSYLAFPILSSAYGVEGGVSSNTSGRMSFGVQVRAALKLNEQG